MLVAVYNLQGNVHQLYLEGDVRLVTLADNPLVTVDVYDVVRGQVLYVNEREGGEAHEYKYAKPSCCVLGDSCSVRSPYCRAASSTPW